MRGKMEKLVIGIDLSTNHVGIVSLDYETGKVFETGILTDLKGFLDTGFVNYEYYLKLWKEKEETKDSFIARRRRSVSNDVEDCILQMSRHFYACDTSSSQVYQTYLEQTELKDVYIAMEDYAFGAFARGIFENAEICGILKNYLYCHKINLRLIDPLSIKKWATGNGHCLKKEMSLVARSEGFDIPDKLVKVVKKSVKKVEVEDFDGPGTDLADAYFLAQMLRTELLVREGKVEIKDLREHKREIFLRVSKRFPENLVVRPFICKGV